jgi:hypothetical protein
MDLPPGRVEIRVNGESVQELTLRGSVDPSFDGRISIPAPAAGWGEKAVVTISFDGQGSAFYTASIEALLGGEDRAPVSSGLEIRRGLFERDPNGSGWRPVDGAVAPGRTVLVVLTLTTPTDRDYVMITDPRPDGLEPIDLPMTALSAKASVLGGLTDRVDLEREWPARLDDFRRTARGDAARESAWAKGLLREIIERKKFSRASDAREIYFPAGGRPGPRRAPRRPDDLLPEHAALRFHGRVVLRARGTLGPPPRAPARVEAMYQPELHASGLETRLDVADGTLVRVRAGRWRTRRASTACSRSCRISSRSTRTASSPGFPRTRRSGSCS